MSTVKNLLDRKGGKVWSIGPDATVLNATEEMNRHHIGALLVMADDQVVGIFTERDILTRVIGSGKSPDQLKVSDVMTSPVAYCMADTPVEVCKAIFTEKRIRHLPVMDSNVAIGVIASGDILAYETNNLQETVRYLESYIYEG
jgi:CBS domain-containing protein